MGRDEADDSWKPYKCGICGKHFLYSMNYKRHVSKHKECMECKELDPMPVKCPHVKYNCDYCDRTFVSQSEYKKCQAQHKAKVALIAKSNHSTILKINLLMVS